MNKLDFLQRVLVAIKAIDAAEKDQHLAIEIPLLNELLKSGASLGYRPMREDERVLLLTRILKRPGTTWYETMQVLKACGVSIKELLNVPWPKERTASIKED